MKQIITGYTFNASAKTITITETGFTDIVLVNVLKIVNLTKGKMIIYDSNNPDTISITVTQVEGQAVISWTENFVYRGEVFENTDKLQITVNTKLSIDATNLSIDGGTP